VQITYRNRKEIKRGMLSLKRAFLSKIID